MKIRHHRLARLLAGLAAAIAMLLPLAEPAPAPSSQVDEHAVKAALLFNICRLTRWPEAAQADPERPVVIAVVGDQRFARRLGTVVGRRRIDGRPVQVRNTDDASGAAGASVVFVAGDSPTRWREVLRVVGGRPVLVVGDSLELCREGAMVCFVREQHRLRVAINLSATHESGLVFSSQLLKIARLVGGDTW